MTPERWRQVEDLWQRAVAHPAAERRSFLDKVCHDAELRAEVDSLLGYEADSFLESPLDSIAATLLPEWSLEPGEQLGRYRILEAAGAGGMGEIFRAHDPRLDRTVAIKLLPAGAVGGAAARERLEREARCISALQHPNICQIFDVDQCDGIDFLVMEHLVGETLRDRLKRGPLPPHEAQRHLVALADALDRAHRSGIVHRDLKPANIMLTRDGPKILDFGIANAISQESTAAGTPPYVAPEQAQGGKADPRSDIFSLGAVAFEMLTGKRPEPGWPEGSATPGWSPWLTRVLRRSIAPNPEERWQSARDLVLELQSPPEEPPPTGRRVRPWLVWAAATITAASLLLGLFTWKRAPSPPPILRMSIPAPEGARVEQMALSSEGSALALTATEASGRRRLFVRRLDSAAAEAVEGTDEAEYPFWAPDGRHVGFFAQGKLKSVTLPEGPVQTLADAPAGRGATWSPSGDILFAVASQISLQRIGQSGGPAAAVPVSIDGDAAPSPRWPQFLPDGQHFLFVTWSGDPTKRMLCAASLGDPRAKVLFPVESSVSYSAPGWLLFIQHGRLIAQRFDSGNLRISGDTIGLAPDVGYTITNGWSDFSVSQSGSLVYRVVSSRFARMTWFDRGGKQLGTLGDPGVYLRPSISPDQHRAAVVKLDTEVGTYDIWTADLGRGILSRLTFDAANDDFPQWSPDSARVLFFSNRAVNGAAGAFFEIAVDSPGTETMIFPFRAGAGYPLDWSTDGRTVLFMKPSDRTGFDIWRYAKSGRSIGSSSPVLQSRFNEVQARLSPDGSRVAYVSDESGRNEVYISPFPAASTKLRISSTGGTEPRWRGDGRELFYFSTDQHLMSVMLTSRDTLSASSPRQLFRAVRGPADAPAAGTGYAATKNGRKFLIPVSTVGEGAEAITILLNWQENRP